MNGRDKTSPDQALRRAILAIEAEAAAGAALTTADVARALIESDLIPRYMEYARLAPSMNPAETIEHVAATWAPRILARLTPAAAEPADEALRLLREAVMTIEVIENFTWGASGGSLLVDEIRAYLAAHPAPEEPRGE